MAKSRISTLAALGAVCLAPAVVRLVAADAGADAADDSRIRVAVSRTFLGDINENDAMAALRVWADSLGRLANMEVENHRSILTPADLLRPAIRKGTIDCFAVTTLEYLQVAAFADPSRLIVDEDAKDGEQYVILVHEESGVRSLADLRGRAVILHQGARACLARTWLETLLVGSNLGAAEGFFGRIATNARISRGVVLPVYFRQADACLLTRQGFDTMCELNPQLARKLRVVATSPKLVTGFVVFHKECPPARRDKFQKALLELHQNPVGQQALMLFQSRRLVVTDQSKLRSAIDLLAAYDRIKGRATAAMK